MGVAPAPIRRSRLTSPNRLRRRVDEREREWQSVDIRHGIMHLTNKALGQEVMPKRREKYLLKKPSMLLMQHTRILVHT